MCRRAGVHVCVCLNYNVVHVRESLKESLSLSRFVHVAWRAIQSVVIPWRLLECVLVDNAVPVEVILAEKVLRKCTKSE